MPHTVESRLLSSLTVAQQERFVRVLRRQLTARLGESTASTQDWHQAALAVDPTVQIYPARGTFAIRRGRRALEDIARCYLVLPRPAVEYLSYGQLLGSKPATYELSDAEWLALTL